MKTTKITLASNNFNISKTKLNKKNNNTNLSFKANILTPQNGQKVVQSMWSRLFPKLQKGLVKTIYKDLTPISKGKYTSDEVKYYYKKNDDKLLLKIFENCTLNKDQKIEKASKIFYQYDTDENGGLKQKIIVNPEFNQNGTLKKAESVHEFYENEVKNLQIIIHKDVRYKNDKISSTNSSEFIYANGKKETYTNTQINSAGEISSFVKKELLSTKDDNHIEKSIWLDNNTQNKTPDIFIMKEKKPRKLEYYIENPVFGDDNKLKSSKLELIKTDQATYTRYNNVYKNDTLNSSELYKVTKHVDRNIIAQDLSLLKAEISYRKTNKKNIIADINKLEEKKNELNQESADLEKQYRAEFDKKLLENRIMRRIKKENVSIVDSESEQKSLKIKDLLKIYDKKSESKEQEQPDKTTKPIQISSRIRNLLNLYENKSKEIGQVSTVPKRKPNSSFEEVKNSIKTLENEVAEKKENKSTTNFRELINNIQKEKEAIDIRLDKLKAKYCENNQELDKKNAKLEELMSYDIVYINYDPKKPSLSLNGYQANIFDNPKLQFKHKELIYNEEQ